jgi:hypothetical protein
VAACKQHERPSLLRAATIFGQPYW